MKRTLVLALFAVAAAAGAQASGTCTLVAPCANVTWQNPGMTSTVVTNTAGLQISGPGWATLWRCTGTIAVCSAEVGSSAWTALGPGTSAVNAVSGTVGQTATVGQFYDQSISYNTTYSYYMTNSWGAGEQSPASAIFQLAVGQAPTQVPNAPVFPVVVVVTSGTYTNPAP